MKCSKSANSGGTAKQIISRLLQLKYMAADYVVQDAAVAVNFDCPKNPNWATSDESVEYSILVKSQKKMYLIMSINLSNLNIYKDNFEKKGHRELK